MTSFASASSSKLVEDSENKVDRALNRFYQRRLQLDEKVRLMKQIVSNERENIYNCGLLCFLQMCHRKQRISTKRGLMIYPNQ